MISYLFIVAMAFFNAVMDATENEPNINESIFKNLPKRFWSKEISWQYAKKIFGYKVDAWHLSKSFMVICMAGAVISSRLAPPPGSWYVVLINIGLVWNGTFWLFYHKIFGVK